VPVGHRYQAKQHREQRPVGPVQLLALRLALQDGELVAQEQDLRGLPRILRRDSRSHATVRVIRRKTTAGT
jgi:hypothetical protein